MKQLTRFFLQGLLVIIPLAATIAVVYWLFISAERLFRIPVQWLLPDSWYLPGMGLVLAIGFTILVGMLVRLYVVSALLKCIEKVLDKLPLVKQVYGGIRDLMKFFASEEDSQWQQVVAVNINGARLIGFVTSDDARIGQKENLISVYLPMSYQVGGYLLYLEESQCEKLDISVQEAMQTVLTANISRSKALGPKT